MNMNKTHRRRTAKVIYPKYPYFISFILCLACCAPLFSALCIYNASGTLCVNLNL
ncbi:hypothetical protein BDV39DRAFT_5974 [Aspergillus sergii]|uniref:Uncharacterized protein n=1 Tax=Aspergillus sergii TaxID=1034303 RepID=A0A5N6XER7_9EURO|nr:hypothetical protein BDV39DRAFT_5974 [Aspergillus sergii]